MKKLIYIMSLATLVLGASCSQAQDKKIEKKMDNGKVAKVSLPEEEWKKKLDPLSYHVLREKGTERAFTGEYYLNKETGIYECKACGNEIFSSEAKYDSGCGWPSFTEPISKNAIKVSMDYSHGMVREEITCAKCDGHLGHRFPDGPKDKGGIRYCINSVSMNFDKKEASSAKAKKDN